MGPRSINHGIPGWNLQMTSGFYSDTYRIRDLVVKIPKDTQPLDMTLYEREIAALKMISKFGWAPKIFGVMHESRSIIMEYAGRSLSPKSAPNDTIQQVEKIFKDLDSINLSHDDMRVHEFRVNDSGRITLVDWGACSRIVNGKRDGTLGVEGVSEYLKPLGERRSQQQMIEEIKKNILK